MNITVQKVNAFTDKLTGGNPAGVVLYTPPMPEEYMKYISKELAVSETAFVFPSKKAYVKLRFFSPDVEVDLCGHATIATFHTLAVKGILPQKKHVTVTQETHAGILPVDISYNNEGNVEKVMMTQGKPIYKNIHLNISTIAGALQIEQQAIENSYPQQIVSTGLFTLPICIKSFDILKTMTPNFIKIKEICTQLHVGSFHIFTFETLEPDSFYHARNFAPSYGINEDPVTGTANGAVTSYLHHHHFVNNKNIICEQGDIIGRPGRVFVELTNHSVRVGGKAILVQEKTIELPDEPKI